MKHFLCIISFLTIHMAFAQSISGNRLEAGIHLGIPTEDVENPINIVYGLDLNYYPFKSIAEVIDIGFAAGYTNFNGDRNFATQLGNAEASFLKFGLSGKINFQSDIFFALNAGFAPGLDDIPGGAYYEPKVGFGKGNFVFHVYYLRIDNGTNIPRIRYTSMGIGIGIRL